MNPVLGLLVLALYCQARFVDVSDGDHVIYPKRSNGQNHRLWSLDLRSTQKRASFIESSSNEFDWHIEERESDNRVTVEIQGWRLRASGDQDYPELSDHSHETKEDFGFYQVSSSAMRLYSLYKEKFVCFNLDATLDKSDVMSYHSADSEYFTPPSGVGCDFFVSGYTDSCSPATCDALAGCGDLDDGCEGTITCDCAAGYQCQDHSCTPCDSHHDCSSCGYNLVDSCGVAYDCPCQEGYMCVGGVCQEWDDPPLEYTEEIQLHSHSYGYSDHKFEEATIIHYEITDVDSNTQPCTRAPMRQDCPNYGVKTMADGDVLWVNFGLSATFTVTLQCTAVCEGCGNQLSCGNPHYCGQCPCVDYSGHTEVETRPTHITRNNLCELPHQKPFGDIFDANTKNVKRTAVDYHRPEQYHDYLLRGEVLNLINYGGDDMELVNGDRLRHPVGSSDNSKFYVKYVDDYIEKPELLSEQEMSSATPLEVRSLVSNISPRCHTGSGCDGPSFSGRDWNNRLYRLYTEGEFNCPEKRPHILMMQETMFGMNEVFNDNNGVSDDCSSQPSIKEWTFKDYDVLNMQKGADSSLLAYDRTRFRLIDYWHTYSYVKKRDFDKMLDLGIPVQDYEIVTSTLCDSDCYPTKNLIIAVLQCRKTNRLIVSGSTHFSSSHLHNSNYGDAVGKHFARILDEYRAIDPNIVMQLGGDYNSDSESSSWDISMKDALDHLGCHAIGANGVAIENLFYSKTGSAGKAHRFGSGSCDRNGHHKCYDACGSEDTDFDYNDALGDCPEGDLMDDHNNPLSDHPAFIVTINYS